MATDEKAELSRRDHWAMAKTEFLDITKAKPRLSVLALKYDLDLQSLMQAAINQRWEELRSQSEAIALVSVTPETRVAVVKQVDTMVLNGVRTIAESAFRTYAGLMQQIETMETETQEEAAAAEADEDDVGRKKTRKPRKPTIGAKLSMLNNLTDGVTKFANSIRELGWVCNPETIKGNGGDALSKALNVTPTTLAPDSAGVPPPIPTEPVKALAAPSVPQLPDSPPIT